MASLPRYEGGESVTFTYSGGVDTDWLNSISGKTVAVLRPLTSDEVDEEVGPMYLCEVGYPDDPQMFQAYEDELS